MAFLILFFLVLTTLELPWPEPPFGWGPGGSLLATAAVTTLPVLAAAWLARRTRRRLVRAPDGREEVLQGYCRGRVLHLAGLMLAHTLALTALGWGWAVQALCGAASPRALPFGAELLLMAPFLLGLLLSWACFYTVERTAGGAASAPPPFGGRWGYVA